MRWSAFVAVFECSGSSSGLAIPVSRVISSLLLVVRTTTLFHITPGTHLPEKPTVQQPNPLTRVQSPIPIVLLLLSSKPPP